MDRGEILQRFEKWLDGALSEDPPAGIPAEILTEEAAPDKAPMDQYTMWAAVTALTQEVKLQGRAFKQLSENLGAESEKRGRKESLNGLLDVRERLLRGLEGMRERTPLRPRFWDRIFAARWREVEQALSVVAALEDGYRLSLSHLDDLLLQFGVRPIDCQGQPFDSRRMNAVDVAETGRVAEGTVLFVHRAGYEWNGELYRPAQVTVAKRPGGGEGVK